MRFLSSWSPSCCLLRSLARSSWSVQVDRPALSRPGLVSETVMIGVQHFLVVSSLLFCIGLWVALSKRNAITVLMGVELMLNAVNVALVAFSRFGVSAVPLTGHVFVLFVITVAAAEASVALAMAVSVYRTRSTIDVDRLDLMKF